jgi:colicin import membrane protein
VNPAPAREAAGGGLPRAAVIVSVVLHVLAFVFVVGVPRLLSSGPSGNKVYVVDLVGLPGNPAPAAPAAPAAAAPPPPPVPEPPKPAPVKPPETPKAEVKKEPPKKAPPKPVVLPDKDAAKKTTKVPEKVPEKKAPEPEPKAIAPPAKDDAGDAEGEEEAAAGPATPAPAPPATTKPGAAPAGEPGGTGTGGSGGSGTGGGDELDFYLTLLKRRIETAWKRPVSTSREMRSAVVFIELSSTGGLLRLELKTPSGYAPFDRSIIQAVRDAVPFPPFPSGLKMDRLARSIEFQLTPLEGDAPQ